MSRLFVIPFTFPLSATLKPKSYFKSRMFAVAAVLEQFVVFQGRGVPVVVYIQQG